MSKNFKAAAPVFFFLMSFITTVNKFRRNYEALAERYKVTYGFLFRNFDKTVLIISTKLFFTPVLEHYYIFNS